MSVDYGFVRPYLTQLWGGEPDSLQLVREGANVVFHFTAEEHGRCNGDWRLEIGD
ncbi:MAG: hypothetical protein HF973_16895 [Chloroflexi bacterium]|nr:hypothetical protein [Chloroflexota bacterium]